MTRSLEDLRSSYRAVEHKLDSLNMDAASILDILPLQPGRKFWSSTEIDWNDPRLQPLKGKYDELTEKHRKLSQEIGRREAIRDDDLPRWGAKQVAYDWLHILGDDGNRWLLDHKLTTITLTEKILENPNFLEEVV